jgi:hypothetical protein
MEELIDQHKIEETQATFNQEPNLELNQEISYLWNDKIELSAKDIGENSKGYKIMHLNEAQKSKKIYNTLMILGIFLAPMAGVFSGINSILNPDENPVLPILSTLFGLTAGCVISIIKFGKYDESSIANKQAAARYTGIESSVRRQLSLYRKDRVQADEYMKWLETKFEELFISAPLLPSEAYSEYSVTAEKLGIQIPNQYQNTIKINSEFESNVSKNISNSDCIEINIENNTNENTSNNSTDIEVPRSSGMASFPELNQYSDKMLQYETRRMMGLI